MKEYLVHLFTETGKYISCQLFSSQSLLKSYLKKNKASYDAHSLSCLEEDLLTINKLDIKGVGYVEIEELATPKRTDTVMIDGIGYITQEEAMRKYNITLSQVKYATKSKNLKKFSAGTMNRLFVEDKFV